MSFQKRCPECKQVLVKNSDKCFCGWKDVSQRVRQRDSRCEYAIGSRRCTSLGTISPCTHGDGSWYCPGHWRTLNDPKLGEAVLLHAEENYHEIFEARRDWRKKLWDKI